MEQIRIHIAEATDLKEILDLQKLAYQSEAKLLDDFSIPPLMQTLPELEAEFKEGHILKAVAETGNIIGSVRGLTQEKTLYIGKLMVHPDWQNQGIGAMLLKEIINLFPDLRCQLFTSDKSEKNLALYRKHGFTEFQRKDGGSFSLVYLEKQAGHL